METLSQLDKNLFENLFILELANNHLGSLERGLKIIRDHAAVANANKVKAAIKLQFRDIEHFIHPDFKGNSSIRYIKKTETTKLTKMEFVRLIEEIRNLGCIPMATPFDEASVDLCMEFDLPIIKIASSDINDWVLIEKIATTRRPVIASTGGASEQDIDTLVNYFEKFKIPLAINHCVSLYPCEDNLLVLDQIDYLKNKYPNHIIGFSTHEYHDWFSSMLISYSKGVRTWERHIDIDYQNVPVSPYCSLPEQCDTWFKAFIKAREMCGGVSTARRPIDKKEEEYLDALVRGAFAKGETPAGLTITRDNFFDYFYLSIPLHKGQLSCREVMNQELIVKPLKANEPLTLEHISGNSIVNPDMKLLILNRGL
ncbi:MAG: N-acetylneuraminic acid synthase [Proteobacteria bacterium]|nr:N-acetylneuraminic acid synthase [Pseudomonadota bacterium]